MRKPPKHAARRKAAPYKLAPNKLGLVACTVFALLVAGGTAGFASMSQSVTLDIDGKTQQVRMFGGKVGDVLEANEVDLKSGDRVNPGPQAQVSGTERIDVRYGKHITTTVDGKKSSHVLHAATVGEAVDELDIDISDDTYVSDGGSKHLPRNGYNLVVSNPKDLTIAADDDTKKITTAAPTVAGALKDAQVDLGDDDEVKPGKTTPVKKDQKLKVTRIDNVERQEQVDLDAPVKVIKDDSMDKGEKQVTKAGKDGKALQHVEVELADGKIRNRNVLLSKTFEQPVKRVVRKGTNDTSDDDSDDSDDDSDDDDDSDEDFGDESGDTVWDKIAECESGGDWHINTGNGYYGGLQFDLQTWHSVGGKGRPDEASRDEQIKRAEKVRSERGLSPWGCAGAAG